jgi:hypothetical protein
MLSRRTHNPSASVMVTLDDRDDESGSEAATEEIVAHPVASSDSDKSSNLKDSQSDQRVKAASASRRRASSEVPSCSQFVPCSFFVLD